MLRFSHDCPFCHKREMPFEVVVCSDNPPMGGGVEIQGAAQCLNRNCLRYASFEAFFNTVKDKEKCLDNHHNDKKMLLTLDESNGVISFIFFPEPSKPNIPKFLPDDIGELFSEAEAVRLIGEQGARASVGQYRSVLDKTLPALAQSAEVPTTDDKGKELSRFPLLDRLSKADLLPASIRNWIGSDGIRKILTAASHGEKITSEQAKELSDITRFILIYVFTLPERVKRARDEFIQ